MSTQSLPAGRDRRLGVGLSLVALAALAVGGSTFALPQSRAQAGISRTVTSTVAGEWGLSSAGAIGPDSSFRGVDAVSPTDAWAVGATNLFTPGAQQSTLIQHWDGSRWSLVPSPNNRVPSAPGTPWNVLSAVDAVSSADVWAVGWTGINGDAGSASLVEHWDGRSWSIVPSPNGVLPSFGFYNFLNGVSGTAANDVWAVGWNGAVENQHRATVQHWNGSAWSLTPVPAVGDNSQHVVLSAVTAIAPNNAWAAGFYADQVNGPITHPFTLHWNGTQWSVVKAADISLGTTANLINLNAIRAISAEDIWAVGNVRYFDAEGASQSQGLIEHWNGTSWSIVRSPNPADTGNTLTGLAPFGANDIWAVGTTGSPQADGARDPLLEHWDGTSWTAVSGPRPDKSYNCGYFGASATPTGAQAVGGCIALDPGTQPHAMPLAALFPGVDSAPPVTTAPPTAPTALTASATGGTGIQLVDRHLKQ